MGDMQKKYREEVLPKLMSTFGYRNQMEVPRIEKVVINKGIGRASQNIKVLESAQEELAAISGQKPVIRRAKKSIAAFKLRKGMPIGCMVTLRGRMMYEFLDRLINAAIPRIRDFRGLSLKSFDGRGNYTIGIREQIIFPEIDYDMIESVSGMSITVSTTAKTDEEARELLSLMGFPFERRR
ncbi:MAG TPA: 50S ribosomal protein L5 [Firmicutes bacterium]|uniref:Large ribosomal subunit protein uL5 n=1 Tax=Candidatus Coatesbacteria bacterium 4484_99 TaxID=1970774 RepID=A0A1W9S287_9BACT|nr:MAG: 50S ribosomal protein L5 [Candidatus Coatesbacteria bacterium 4484_99]RLC39139.1 MAG: 50S ribosomal protein L5 [Candidatus Coatesbacteria bacterium]HDM43492.1 50S ribosomal protein L5 [Bacillota bacterium]RLC41408.1 MAG: 50S ribosomal protein L5 [Candidatus Coatesbacteria bacterium]RLC44716.1 MAG: 50S ribosomal protein L5 [Candidatus Coatesbacteria bacterium]